MDIEYIREYCLSKPLCTEDQAFGDDCVLFRIDSRIFACIPLQGSCMVVLKCDPDLAVELRDRYAGISPAWHWNKRYWNQLDLCSDIPDDLVMRLIDHSYGQVLRKIPRKRIMELGIALPSESIYEDLP